MSSAQLTGRVAVITGASSGIGEATARALAAEGHTVALLARRSDRIQALSGELGNGAVAIEADVTDRDSIVAAAERVQQELGGADVLVNNAGVMLTAPFASDQREEHRRMVETNLLVGRATGLAGCRFLGVQRFGYVHRHAREEDDEEPRSNRERESADDGASDKSSLVEPGIIDAHAKSSVVLFGRSPRRTVYDGGQQRYEHADHSW
jgi:NAD(P)-dependent dehydrogenase (short-subunit alcohol dehydrogenase family)